ncbi:gibberellin 2-oxidase [Diplodia corticola]|uniref:Gibberellin 2-oxidase n=1 Tax=Diplodia corticola TaxID=236234 RepID=A0A1J9QZS0_9PEZI|nr:gibberellin 2-oxidase [Diplodia corticola]OJD33865.1 gibberellin 2-oxidase [Diplodia corticola]
MTLNLAPLNLSDFITGSASKRNEFTTKLLGDLARTGFCKITGHGFSEEDVERLFSHSKKFFKISPESKTAIAHIPGPEPQRGWSRIGSENTTKLFGRLENNGFDTERQDAREHFDQGPTTDTAYPNKWPAEAELPGFREEMEAAFLKFKGVSDDILSALEEALNLPAGAFRGMVSNDASEFRLNHYPSISVEEMRRGQKSRIWPHYDLGVITLLFQDSVGGLEIEDRTRGGNDAFLPVTRGAPSELVVNISETFQRWTNGFIPAGLHRVTTPAHLKSLESGVLPERYSIAYFCKADRQANVGPLERFVTENTPAAYDDVTAMQYQQRRLLQAY